MGMPKNLVFVRHGESEANIIQNQTKKTLEAFPESYNLKRDREHRLSKLGREQTVKTGQFLKKEYPDGFDVIYASDFIRAQETAALVCLEAGWKNVKIKVEPQFGERNWGDFHLLKAEDRAKFFADKKRDPLHVSPFAGETLLSARLRSRVLLERSSRQYSGKNVLIFSHGEFIEAAWSEIAKMRTEEQIEFFHSPLGDIKNCQVIQFSPQEEGSKLQQVRTSNPYLGKVGDWLPLEKKTFSPEELLIQVDKYHHILDESKFSKDK